MNKDSIKADFLAARAMTAKTVMNATGWESGKINPENLGGDSVFLYAYDYESNWTWCCSMPKDSFFDLLSKSKDINHEEPIIICEKAIANCSQCGITSDEVNNDLAISLSVYTGITKSFKLTNNATKANHFVVIRYGLTNTLRPFAINGPKNHLVEVNYLLESVQKVIAMDSFNHPEMIADDKSDLPKPQ